MSEQFAVLQKDLAFLPIEVLRNACTSVKGLTAADATFLLKDAFGILVNGLTRDQATAFSDALRAGGIDTEIVARKELPLLPPPKTIPRWDCEEAGLRLFDSLGLQEFVPWANIMLVAVGTVGVVEFTKRESIFATVDPFTGEEVREFSTREKMSAQPSLEVVTARLGRRFSATGDRMNYTYLGRRLTPVAATNFRLLVQDILQRAPHAGLNMGAHALQQGQECLQAYPTKGAFAEEMTWMLWRMKQAGWDIGGKAA